MHFKFVIVLKICNQPLTPNIPTTLGMLNQLCHVLLLFFSRLNMLTVASFIHESRKGPER